MKNRKIGKLLLAGCLVLLYGVPVHAETFDGDSGWNVTFTKDNKMSSNFEGINDAFQELQPGDDVIVNISLKNENSKTSDWYMANEVLRSLEEGASRASGGAYTYTLSYTNAKGEKTTLYDSDTVGGENSVGTGLKAATNALDEYFYLDTLAKGKSGSVTLRVALDGETQGNDYQNTMAELKMNFAAEPRRTSSGSGSSSGGSGGGSSGTPAATVSAPSAVSDTVRMSTVQTGDDTNLLLYIILTGVSGCGLLAASLYRWKLSRAERRA